MKVESEHIMRNVCRNTEKFQYASSYLSHIAQFGKSYLSFLITVFFLRQSYTGKNIRSTRAYENKLECDHLDTHVHTHSYQHHYVNDVIRVRKHNRAHAQRATRLWAELVILPEFDGAILKSLQIGGVNPL